MTTLSKTDVFRDAMASFASGITAITTREAGQSVGLIATSVCSLSATPPSLIFCVNKTASAHDVILRQRHFAVNLLASDQKSVAQRFASHKGAERFEPDLWTSLSTGAPILKNALVAFDCTVLAVHDGFSHSIIVGEIVEAQLGATETGSCLLWHQRDFARSALFGD